MPSKNKKKLSRQEQRDLDIEIGFIEGVVRRDPDFIEALQILGENYTRRGRYKAGLRIDERLVKLRPDDPMVHFNLACSYSLNEDFQKAVDALEKALDLGYCDFRWLSKDPDLSPLRQQPEYKKIQAKVRAMKIKVR